MFFAIVRRHRPFPLLSFLCALALAPACEKGNAPASSGAASPDAAEDGAGALTDQKTASAPQLPEAEAILARAAEALGGREAIDRVQSFYYKGHVEMLEQNIHGDLEIWWKGGDFFMEQIVPGVGELRAGRLGDEFWSDDPVNGRRRLHGVEAEQLAWASTLLLAADWQLYFDRAETVAERTVGGRTVHDVKLSTKSGLDMTMTFDSESGLQVGQAFEQVSNRGRQPFDVTFEDYRDVDGIKIAFKQIIDAKFQKMEQVIAEVRINAEVDPTKFAFPRSGADLVRQPAREKG